MKRRSLRWLLAMALATGSYQSLFLNRVQAARFESFPLASLCHFNDPANDTSAFITPIESSTPRQVLACQHDLNDQANWIARDFKGWGTECTPDAFFESESAPIITVKDIEAVRVAEPLVGEAPVPPKAEQVVDTNTPKSTGDFSAEPGDEYAPYDFTARDQSLYGGLVTRRIGDFRSHCPYPYVIPIDANTTEESMSVGFAQWPIGAENTLAESPIVRGETSSDPEAGVCLPPWEGSEIVGQDEYCEDAEILGDEWPSGDVGAEWLLGGTRQVMGWSLDLVASVNWQGVSGSVTEFIANVPSGWDQAMAAIGKYSSTYVATWQAEEIDSGLPLNTYSLDDESVLLTPRDVAFEPISEAGSSISPEELTPENTTPSFGVGMDNALSDVDSNVAGVDAFAARQTDVIADPSFSEVTVASDDFSAAPMVEDTAIPEAQVDSDVAAASDVTDRSVSLAREVGHTIVGRVAETMSHTGNWLLHRAKWLEKFNREVIANHGDNIR